MDTTIQNSEQTFFIRPSGLAELFDCPARWEAKNLKGLRLPTSSAALLGTAVHRGSAVFDQSRIDNAGITADEAAGEVVDAIFHPSEEIVWEEAPNDIEKVALPLHHLYCEQLSPKCDFIGVEVETPRVSFEDLGITIGGTTDRIYQTQDGQIGIADIKTGKTVVAADGTVKTAGFALQLGMYEMLVRYGLDQPVAAPALVLGLSAGKTAQARRAGLAAVASAQDILLGESGRPGMLEMAAKLLKSGNFYGNPKSVLCSPKYCPAFDQCPFHC